VRRKGKSTLQYGLLILLVMGLSVGVTLVTEVTRLGSKAASPIVYLDDKFEYSPLSSGGWYPSNGTFVKTEPGLGKTGNALAVKHNGTAVYAHRDLSNLTARVSVSIKDDRNKLNDPGKDTYVFVSVNTNSPGGGGSIGIRPKTSVENYTVCPTANLDGCIDTGIARTTGWHDFKLFVTPKGMYGKIDGTSLSNLPFDDNYIPVNSAVDSYSTYITRINIGIYGNDANAYWWYFDNVYINSFPGPQGSDKEEDLSLSKLQLYLSSYGNINPGEVINGINIRYANCAPDNVACNEDKLKDYMALGYLAVAKGLDYRINNNTANGNSAVTIISAMLANRLNKPWRHGNGLSGARVDSELAWAYWLVKDRMTSDQIVQAENGLKAEADYFLTWRGYNACCGDPGGGFNTSGEENAWPGTFLNWASIILSYRPESANWLTWSKKYLYHSLTANPNGYNSGETYGGITTQTLWNSNSEDKYLFSNHGFKPHPGYMMGTLYESLAAKKIRMKYGLAIDNTVYDHHIADVWKKNTDNVAYGLGSKKYVNMRGLEFNINPKDITFHDPTRESFGSGGMSNLTFYAVLKDLFPGLNTPSGINDLGNHAFEYQYYIRDSYLGTPVSANQTISSADVSDKRNKMIAFLLNGMSVADYGMYLFLYELNVPLPVNSANCILNGDWYTGYNFHGTNWCPIGQTCTTKWLVNPEISVECTANLRLKNHGTYCTLGSYRMFSGTSTCVP
jgi:hypothetical protein